MILEAQTSEKWSSWYVFLCTIILTNEPIRKLASWGGSVGLLGWQLRADFTTQKVSRSWRLQVHVVWLEIVSSFAASRNSLQTLSRRWRSKDHTRVLFGAIGWTRRLRRYNHTYVVSWDGGFPVQPGRIDGGWEGGNSSEGNPPQD